MPRVEVRLAAERKGSKWAGAEGEGTLDTVKQNSDKGWLKNVPTYTTDGKTVGKTGGDAKKHRQAVKKIRAKIKAQNETGE